MKAFLSNFSSKCQCIPEKGIKCRVVKHGPAQTRLNECMKLPETRALMRFKRAEAKREQGRYVKGQSRTTWSGERYIRRFKDQGFQVAIAKRDGTKLATYIGTFPTLADAIEARDAAVAERNAALGIET